MLSIDHDTCVVLLSPWNTRQSMKTCIIELLCTKRSAIEEYDCFAILLFDPIIYLIVLMAVWSLI